LISPVQGAHPGPTTRQRLTPVRAAPPRQSRGRRAGAAFGSKAGAGGQSSGTFGGSKGQLRLGWWSRQPEEVREANGLHPQAVRKSRVHQQRRCVDRKPQPTGPRCVRAVEDRLLSSNRRTFTPRRQHTAHIAEGPVSTRTKPPDSLIDDTRFAASKLWILRKQRRPCDSQALHASVLTRAWPLSSLHGVVASVAPPSLGYPTTGPRSRTA
jgi:hypothetical protein